MPCVTRPIVTVAHVRINSSHGLPRRPNAAGTVKVSTSRNELPGTILQRVQATPKFGYMPKAIIHIIVFADETRISGHLV